MRWLIAPLALLLGSLAQAPGGSVLLRLDYNLVNATVMGAYQGGKWLEAEQLTRLASTNFTLYNPLGSIGSGTANPTLTAPTEACDWNRDTIFKVQQIAQTLRPIYALAAPWNPMPRSVSSIQPSQAHRKTIEDELRKLKVNSPVQISQALRVDLDGDGRVEVLLSANSPAWQLYEGEIRPVYAEKKGDYAMVLVRKLLSDTDLRSFVLDSIHAQIPKPEDQVPTVVTRRIGAVLDLDGDGKMEVLVEDWVHEGHGIRVYRWDGKKFAVVLEWGCGV